MISSFASGRRSTFAFRCALLLILAAGAFLVGCGDKSRTGSQTAARVNGDDITVHQINFVLSHQKAMTPEQAASATTQVLDHLIDQELAVQKATDQKLDRTPVVTQAIEAARRDIIARAYLEKIGAGAPKPTDEEIKKYYGEHPELFSHRRVYALQEIAIEAAPEQVDDLRKKLEAAKNVSDFLSYMNTNHIKFVGKQVVRGAEQLPLASLPTLAKMKDGQTIFNKTDHGAQVVVLVAAHDQPVDEEHARPAIERYLLNQHKQKVIDDDLKALRASAEIEYVGDFQKTAAEREAAQEKALEVKPSVSPLAPEPGASEIEVEDPKPSVSPLVGTPASAVEPMVPVRPASAPSASVLDKGLKGLK